MTIETYRPSPSEISRVALGSPARAQQSPRGQSRELEKPSFGADEDFTLAVSPPPRWPRIFPTSN